MAANTFISLSDNSQAGVIQFLRASASMLNQQWNVRENFRAIDLEYMREMNLTSENQKAVLANRYGDATKYRDITIPVVLPAVESAVVYQSSVFLTGTPIFESVASPRYQDAALQFNTTLEENATRGGWVRELQMFFRDGFKYNFSAIEVTWDRKVTYALETDSTYKSGKEGKPVEVVWEGNCLNRWDPYNTFWDTRVPITQVPERGEFAGRTELMSRIQLKKLLAELPNKIVANIKPAFESAFGVGTGTISAMACYYIPPVNWRVFNTITPLLGTNWMQWAGASGALDQGTKIDYKNLFEVTTLYARILPSDFRIIVPEANTPQVWKFIIVNQSVVIYAERMSNAHEKIPVLFGQPLEDGLSYQTKSLAENVIPIQSVSSALINSVIAARRRAISDRGLYDPSRVGEAQINSTNPSAKIPVKPAAYGKPLNEAYFPIPFDDRNSATIMQELGPIVKLADIITGQNPSRQGQFVKGNKTRTEYADVMENSNGRDQACSLLLEDQVFGPMKMILKSNTLQYQGVATYYNRAKQTDVAIDPIILRNAILEFKISDGLTPTAKLISSDTLQTAIQVLGSSPQLAAEYNIGPMFSYLMKTQSAQISEFEKPKEQVAFEQAMSQWMQMAQLAIQNKQQFTIPQPTPEQYGYLVNGQIQQNKPVQQNALQTMLTTLAATPPETTDAGAAQ